MHITKFVLTAMRLAMADWILHGVVVFLCSDSWGLWSADFDGLYRYIIQAYTKLYSCARSRCQKVVFCEGLWLFSNGVEPDSINCISDGMVPYPPSVDYFASYLAYSLPKTVACIQHSLSRAEDGNALGLAPSYWCKMLAICNCARWY